MTDRFVWVGCRILMFIGIFFFLPVFLFLFCLFLSFNFIFLPFSSLLHFLSLFISPSFFSIPFIFILIHIFPSIFFPLFLFTPSFLIYRINIFPSFPLPQTIPKTINISYRLPKTPYITTQSHLQYAMHYITSAADTSLYPCLSLPLSLLLAHTRLDRQPPWPLNTASFLPCLYICFRTSLTLCCGTIRFLHSALDALTRRIDGTGLLLS